MNFRQKSKRERTMKAKRVVCANTHTHTHTHTHTQTYENNVTEKSNLGWLEESQSGEDGEHDMRLAKWLGRSGKDPMCLTKV